MISLVYVSAATADFGERDLSELLAQCRRNNPRLGITGLLLYSGGNFMQAIEGEEAAVDRMAGIIAKDPRHRRLIRLYRADITARQFPNWSMALRQLSDLPVEDREDCVRLLTAKFESVGPDAEGCAHKLLRSFQNSMA